MRIGTVSFLSNANSVLSVPHRNVPVDHHVVVGDEVTITRRLRELAPPAAPGTRARAARPGDAAVAVRPGRVRRLAPVDGASPRPPCAGFGLDAAGRGFLAVVDGGTYVTRATDLGARATSRSTPPTERTTPRSSPVTRSSPRRSPSSTASVDAPAALAVMTAIAKTRGLRIVIDAGDLGPREMGTQVQILSLVRELAGRDDVDTLQVAVPGAVPAYAEPYLESPKIRRRRCRRRWPASSRPTSSTGRRSRSASGPSIAGASGPTASCSRCRT